MRMLNNITDLHESDGAWRMPAMLNLSKSHVAEALVAPSWPLSLPHSPPPAQ